MTNSVNKTKIKVLFALLFSLSMQLTVPGQTTASLNVEKNAATEIGKAEIYIFLNPFEKREAIEIEESCLVLLSDFPTEINLPLQKPIKTVLSAGTRFFVPKGKYKIENQNDLAVEYKLIAAAECRQN